MSYAHILVIIVPSDGSAQAGTLITAKFKETYDFDHSTSHIQDIL